MARHLQLVFLHLNNEHTFYPADQGWRIDSASRCVVIGTDLPRTYVPLDTVKCFTIEAFETAAKVSLDKLPDWERELLEQQAKGISP